MMKSVLVAGVATACGVCCALPSVLPLLGSLVASASSLAFGWTAAALASLVALAAMLVSLRRRAHLRVLPFIQASPRDIRGVVGQAPSSRQDLERDVDETVACALPRRERAHAIARLAERGLLAHRQCGPSLYLCYSGTVAREIETLVMQEQESCPFLDFDLTHHGDAVQLIITAPTAAAGVAPTLTSHFLGNSSPQSACSSSCGCTPKAKATA